MFNWNPTVSRERAAAHIRRKKVRYVLRCPFIPSARQEILGT